MAKVASVCAVCVSEAKGTIKTPVNEIVLQKGHGIVGDAHAGDWHRQVSLLAQESADTPRQRFPTIAPGAFAENILTQGLVLYTLPVGTHLRVGPALLQITQIGKECHQDCEIRRQTGDCVMPREGVFAIVITEGTVRAGDVVEVAAAPAS
ncbi:MAG: MOSC domain-containing protein [Coriobacteriia bacterium]|nr:MOSC domain-containing protein [Coriobacteriia bacterium]